MLPSGELTSSCEVAADQWVVNDPSKPHCPHTSFTTEHPATTLPRGTSATTHKDCASPLCELIKDRCPGVSAASVAVSRRVSGAPWLSVSPRNLVCREEMRQGSECGAGSAEGGQGTMSRCRASEGPRIWAPDFHCTKLPVRHLCALLAFRPLQPPGMCRVAALETQGQLANPGQS